MKQRGDILALASAIQDASIIQVHSGDREPGSTLSLKGRKWIIAGLKLLANGKANRTRKKKRN